MTGIKYDEQKSLKQNLKAIFSWVNFSAREITDGRVKYQGEELETAKNNLILAEQQITELDIQNIEAEQANTDLDIRVLALEM